MTKAEALVEQINALLAINASGAAVPRVPGLAVQLLTEAAAALSRTLGEAVQVKALEWRTDWHSDDDTRLGWTGRDGLGHSVWVSAWKADEWITGGKVFADLDKAKAAAQADYESRIRSALHPAPAAPAGEIEARLALWIEEAREMQRNGEYIRGSVFHGLVEEIARLSAALSASPAPGAIAPGVEEIAKVIHASKLLQPARGPWLGDNSVTEKFCMLAAADVLAAIRSGEKAG